MNIGKNGYYFKLIQIYKQVLSNLEGTDVYGLD